MAPYVGVELWLTIMVLVVVILGSRALFQDENGNSLYVVRLGLRFLEGKE